MNAQQMPPARPRALFACLLLCSATAFAQPALTPSEGALPSAEPAPLELVGETDAPTTPTVSVLAGTGTMVAGLGVGFGFLQPFLRSRDPLMLTTPLTLVGVSAGLVLFGLGPNMGDALNGDLFRLATRGSLRTLMALACAWVAVFGGPIGATLGAFGSLAVASWTVIDLLGSQEAPYRWAVRENRARADAAGLAY